MEGKIWKNFYVCHGTKNELILVILVIKVIFQYPIATINLSSEWFVGERAVIVTSKSLVRFDCLLNFTSMIFQSHTGYSFELA